MGVDLIVEVVRGGCGGRGEWLGWLGVSMEEQGVGGVRGEWVGVGLVGVVHLPGSLARIPHQDPLLQAYTNRLH